ncbi:hypothetical protein A3731_41050 [Roseovarius sp. HI0049]|nr:hypothetical protein A3731_43355 [Roseovarius sp. HI0049]KZY38056.1 hypothetical protein A3731_41050 [Roseovarius sp. HI0049]
MADSEQTVTIDGKEYALDSLSEAARTQLANVRITDQEITRLERQLAITRTARQSYARSLSEKLPEG